MGKRGPARVPRGGVSGAAAEAAWRVLRRLKRKHRVCGPATLSKPDPRLVAEAEQDGCRRRKT